MKKDRKRDQFMYTHEEIRIVWVKFSTFGWAYVVFLILQVWYKKSS